MLDPETFADLTELSLEQLEMAEETRAANLRKAIIKEIDMWIDHRVAAGTARFVRRLRRELANRAKRDVESKPQELLPE